MTPQEYQKIIMPIRAQHPNLCIFGILPKKRHHQTFRIEIESGIYAELFEMAVTALKYLLPKYDEPEGLRLIVNHLKRKHEKYFPEGVVLAACIYKGCKFDEKTRYSDMLHGDAFDCLIIPPHLYATSGQ